ncbi:hypothetical protein [Nonomuraea basaltis]|uniref:hypothetical protein n=1 Tax=Nonomuraea basaltis TaxID=2495887 RepID=UPI00110C6AEC|nr:hypothetical protein [Nonomuraea basaltis]TMR95594.1 hypothetical protein EJK15_27955 [Nonomuraea basaltis]
MADRTVAVRLQLNTQGFTAGARTASKDLGSLNRDLTKSAGFVKGFRKQLEDATARLPKIEIDADSSAAEVKMAQVRHELEQLAGKTIGVDIDADTAMMEMQRLRGELLQLEDGASFTVRAGIQQATQDLAVVEAEVRRLDGRTANVRVDADTTSALSALGNLTTTGTELGGVLSKSLSVIGSVGPGQVAILSGAILALPTVASIAATGIVAAIGGGLAAVGIKAASQSKEVQEAWKRTGKAIKADAAEPLEGSLVQAADVAQRAFEGLKPTLARIFADLVPDLDVFIKAVGDGVVSLGPSLERIGKAFGKSLRELGNEMPAIMKSLGNAFETFSDMVDDDPKMLANLVKDAAALLEFGADLLSWAGEIKLAFQAPLGPAGTQAGTDYFFRELFGGTPAEIAAQQGQLSGVLAGMQESASAGAQAILAMGAGAGAASEQVGSLNSQIGAFNSLTGNADQAAITFAGSVDRLAASLKKNGDTLDINSQKGRDNKQALIDATQAAADHGTKVLEETGSVSKANDVLNKHASELRGVMRDAGLSDAAIDKLIQRYLKMPKSVKTDVNAPGAEKSIREMERLGKSITDLPPSKTINVTVRTEKQEFAAKISQQPKKNAMGAIDRYTAGGIDYAAAAGVALRPMPPGIVSKPTVLFGEGSSGRGATEAFIPYEDKFRGRAIELLGQVASDFGLEVYNKNAARRISDVSEPLILRGDQVSLALGSAVETLDATFGQSGSLTSAIGQVGSVGESLVAGWTAGSAVIGDSVTGMGELVSVSVDGLTESVGQLTSAVSAAASAATGKPGTIPGAGPKKKPPKKKGNASGSSSGSASGSLPRKGNASGSADGSASGSLPSPGGLVEGHYGTGGSGSAALSSSAFTMGAPVNFSRVSAPQQVSGSGGYASLSAAGMETVSQQLATVVDRIDRMEKRTPVVVQNMQVRERADIDVIVAKLDFKVNARG